MSYALALLAVHVAWGLYSLPRKYEHWYGHVWSFLAGLSFALFVHCVAVLWNLR